MIEKFELEMEVGGVKGRLTGVEKQNNQKASLKVVFSLAEKVNEIIEVVNELEKEVGKKGFNPEVKRKTF